MIKHLLLLTSFAFADIAIEPYAKSYHWDRDKDRNEDHEYIGVVYRYEQFDFGVATMINSHDNRSNSFYVGYRLPLYQEEDVALGLFGICGYRTGYNTDLLGYGGVYARYKDVYIKTAVNTNLIGFTIGYIFKGIK